MHTLRLAALMLWRDWRAGELRVLLAAVVIAVGALSGVGFFTDRIQVALERQASHLLGADLVLRADHPPAREFALQARQHGLRSELTVSFPSMVSHAEGSQLVEIKAVGAGYPLRGKLRLAATLGDGAGVPASGSAWADERLMTQLGLRLGDWLEVGQRRLRVDAVLAEEPDRAGDFLHIAPRLMINRDDLATTGLIQEGSRVVYRLLLAGDEKALGNYRQWAARHLERGEKLEGLADARPEVRTALERAQRYLGLSALLSVVLAGVAIAVAVRRFVARHQDHCAMLRCLGASQRAIVQMYVWQFLGLGLAGGLLGLAIGYATQVLLSQWLAGFIAAPLPPPSVMPVAIGFAASLLLLFGFALPPLMRLRQVPALRVFRRELAAPAGSDLLALLLAFGLLGLLMLHIAAELRFGLLVLAALLVVLLLAWGLTRLLARGVSQWGGHAGRPWRHGVASLPRRGSSTVAQVTAFGLAGMVLLALSVVRGDLTASWLARIPPDAPNRFLINIQPDQLAGLRALFRHTSVGVPDFSPMVRGRLVAINHRPVTSASYTDERARHLAEREFNLSWADRMPRGNRLVMGDWPVVSLTAPAFFSVEQGIAQTLGIRLGDTLTYDVAGTRVSAVVRNLRQVEWDSFRVNFFVLASPGLLETFPTSYITSFYLPPGENGLIQEVVRRFPNVTVIDVAAVVNQIRGLMDKAAYAMQLVFLFMLAAGVTVLQATLLASRDERTQEAAIWRTLGATRRQLLVSAFAEFAAIGLLAGTIAALGAGLLQYVMSQHVLHLPFHLSYWLLPMPLLGALWLGLTGLWGVRRLIAEPPLSILRRV